MERHIHTQDNDLSSSIESLRLCCSILHTLHAELPRIKNLLPEPDSSLQHHAHKDIITARDAIMSAVKNLTLAVDKLSQ